MCKECEKIHKPVTDKCYCLILVHVQLMFDLCLRLFSKSARSAATNLIWVFVDSAIDGQVTDSERTVASCVVVRITDVII